MATAAKLATKPAMASRWRRRSLCILVAERPVPVALRSISGRGAAIDANIRPAVGSIVALHHPQAGAIVAQVSAHTSDGIDLDFTDTGRAMSFALAAIAGDMTRN